MRLAAYEPDIAANLGAMIRISACMGVGLDVIEPCGFPLSAKAARRAAMDYIDLTDMQIHDSWAFFQRSYPSSRRVLLTTEGAENLYQFRFQADDILLVGRESAGVPSAVHAAVDARIRIPMPGGGRSLNVAVSAAIALSEAGRQLGHMT